MTEQIEQRTEEWFNQRIGKVTASRIADVMTKIKSGESAARRNYRYELLCERLTGTRPESYTNAAMQWGVDNEPAARAAFEAITFHCVSECGFIVHPAIQQSGASPDGFIESEDAILEIKCPQTATHIETLLSGQIDKKYVYQMFWQMACTGRQKGFFVSYDPRLPGDMQAVIIELPRDNAMIAEMETEVKNFLAELENDIIKIQERVKK